MRPIELGGVTLDLCDSCEGVWFDKGELASVIKLGEDVSPGSDLAVSFESDVELSESPGDSTLRCPRCAEALSRYNYGLSSEAVIDACAAACGVWLDDGEIRVIFDFVASGDNSLDQETVQNLNSRLDALAEVREKRERRLIDSLVTLDNEDGLRKYPGKIFQLIATGLHKIHSRIRD